MNDAPLSEAAKAAEVPSNVAPIALPGAVSAAVPAAPPAVPEADPPENQNPLSAGFWLGRVDLRPLGLFRITFGTVAFAATADLSGALIPLLSDTGVMPRAALLGGLARFNRFSIYDLVGPDWQLIALFTLTLISIAAFAVGYRTRLANLAAFILVTGLHERNLQVFDGADNVIRVMLFWSLFTDVGARYSIDALRRARAGLPVRQSGWAFPVRMAQLQFAWIYLDSVLWKLQGKYWHKGEALRFALGLDHTFTRELGAKLFDSGWFIHIGSYYTLAAEGAFLFLVFAPFWQPWVRALGLLVGFGLHGGIWLLMNVGNFAYVMPATYPLFFEPKWAEWCVAKARKLGASLVGPQWMDWGRGFGESFLRFSRIEPTRELPFAARFPALAKSLHLALPPALLLVFVGCLWFSIPPPVIGRPMPFAFQQSIQEAELWQSWDMFAPDPMNADFWLKGVGTLADGTEVDPLRGNNGGPLPSIFPHFYFSRWTKFTTTIAYGDEANILQFGRFLCREWNTPRLKHKSMLKSFKLYRVDRRTPDLGQPYDKWQQVLIWDHTCY